MRVRVSIEQDIIGTRIGKFSLNAERSINTLRINDFVVDF